MKRLEIFPVVVLLLLAAYFAAGSVGLGIGSLNKPGPGFFPAIGAALVLASGGFTLFGQLHRRPTGPAGQGEPLRWWSVACVLGAIVVFALLVELLGFFICTFLMFVFFQRGVTSQPWPKSLIVAASATAATFVLFELILNAQLPKGFLAF
jgi:putative tricarboxylic transport membrane protein